MLDAGGLTRYSVRRLCAGGAPVGVHSPCGGRTVELGAPRQTRTITLNADETGVCIFTNDDRAGHLILVKQVENGTTGATAVPTDWTLSAAAARGCGDLAPPDGPSSSPID